MIPSHYTNERGLVGIVRSQSLWAREFSNLNDRTEFVYAIPSLCEEALPRILSVIPADLRAEVNELEAVRKDITDGIEFFKKQLEATDGYGSLYVASFAQGRKDVEDSEGILSLWARYTENIGYCMQFAAEAVDQLVTIEEMRYNYAFIQLAPVIYGDDRKNPEFRFLVEELALRAFRQLYLKTHDARLQQLCSAPVEPENSYLIRLLKFLATHKHPSFDDERELRIFACPNATGEGRTFTGLASAKTIYCDRTIGRYIALGENLLPGLIPETILIGPKGKLMPQTMLDALYPAWPKIKKSTIPLK